MPLEVVLKDKAKDFEPGRCLSAITLMPLNRLLPKGGEIGASPVQLHGDFSFVYTIANRFTNSVSLHFKTI